VIKNFLIFLAIGFATLVVFRHSFFTFFAQDDFILINEFSQSSLGSDFKNAVGLPKVTHWRPMHNMFFLAAGNLFGDNYFGYHVLTFLIHASASLLIFKIVERITKNFRAAFVSSLVYAVHPSHFVTLFWISGSATTIGFVFLLFSFYLYLLKKQLLSLVTFVVSLLASEAMVVGIGIFSLYKLLLENKLVGDSYLKKIFFVSVVFLVSRFAFLTPQSTYDAYQIKVWPAVITNTKYYLLRIAGFAEASGDLTVSIALLGLLLFIFMNITRELTYKSAHKAIILGLSLIILGLFPFALISNLSAHYMNISIFGFAILIGLAISKFNQMKILAFLVIFLTLSLFNVSKTYENNWVVKRSSLAQRYIQEVENSNIPEESMIIFNDNYISTSKEAYIALGAGKAIDFLFEGKNYQYCFSAFENCEKK